MIGGFIPDGMGLFYVSQKVNAMNEDNISEVSNKFKQYKNKKIALYGTGEMTEKIIIALSDYNIVALLDGAKTDGVLYGKPIIRIEEAIKQHVDVIVIVARKIFHNAIVKRILKPCSDNNIMVLDLYGDNLIEIEKKKVADVASEERTIAWWMEKEHFSEINKMCMNNCFSPLLEKEKVFNDRDVYVFREINRYLEREERSLANQTKICLALKKIVEFRLENNERLQEVAQFIGYLYIAPVITDSFLWLVKKSEEIKVDQILLAARDGYLFGEFWKIYQPQTALCNKRMLYFLTSREAAVSSNCNTWEDVEFMSSLGYMGTTEEMLESRFSIHADHYKEKEPQCSQKNLKKNLNEILEVSNKRVKGYLKYIEDLKLDTESPIGFFDFVSSGTCQMCLQDIMKVKLFGFYFYRMPDEFDRKKKLNISSFITGKEDIDFIERIYFFLESVITAPTYSLLYFEEDGKPVYDFESIDKDGQALIENIQKGILDYFKDYTNAIPKSEYQDIEVSWDMSILKLCDISEMEELIENITVNDRFGNKSAKISDLL